MYKKERRWTYNGDMLTTTTTSTNCRVTDDQPHNRAQLTDQSKYIVSIPKMRETISRNEYAYTTQ